MGINFLGLSSLIYPTKDIETSKKWWSEALGVAPYFESDGYVGFDLGGYELGFNSDSATLGGPLTYIAVDDVDDAVKELTAKGAALLLGPTHVGGGIIIADIESPNGDVFGVIYNPHFKGQPQVS